MKQGDVFSGLVVRNLPGNAGDASSNPSQGTIKIPLCFGAMKPACSNY